VVIHAGGLKGDRAPTWADPFLPEGATQKFAGPLKWSSKTFGRHRCSINQPASATKINHGGYQQLSTRPSNLCHIDPGRPAIHGGLTDRWR
jgi:hypothetical protein